MAHVICGNCGNLWENNVLHQLNTHFDNTQISKSHNIYVNIYQDSLRPFSVVQEEGTTVANLPKALTGLSLKLLKKIVWVAQFTSTTKNLQVVEELVQEQLIAHHNKESASHWILLHLLLKGNLENGELQEIQVRVVNKLIQQKDSLH